MDVSVVADDLTGAMEAASMFLLRTTRIDVTLGTKRSELGELTGRSRVQVVDTDSRHMDSRRAAAAVGTVWDRLGSQGAVVKKVDSLLRGHLASETEQVRSRTAEMVVAMALPASGRTVVDGKLLVHGIPLCQTDLWRLEPGPPPVDVAAAFGSLPTVVIDLPKVRAGTERLAATLRSAVTGGYLPICDGCTDGDLDEVVRAADMAFRRPVLVGSAALAAATARNMTPDQDPARLPELAGGVRAPAVPSTATGVLVVVGSRAPLVGQQLDRLGARDPRSISIAADDLFDPVRRSALSERIRQAVAVGAVTVAYLDPLADIRPAQAQSMAHFLAAAVAAGAALAPRLLLTGGETARRVLDQLDINRLQPLTTVHHGAVISLARGNRLIATRPGSFGDVDSLAAIVAGLIAQPHHYQEESS